MKWVVFLIQEQQDAHTSVESGYSLWRKQSQLACEDEDLTALSTHEIDVSRVSCKQPKNKKVYMQQALMDVKESVYKNKRTLMHI